TKRPPRLCTCSFAAGLKSYAEITAPKRRAVAIACSPATPQPITNTRAGVTVPAAVVSMGKMRGWDSAASSTALYPATVARDVVGAVAKNLHHYVGGGKHRGAVGDDLRALLDIKGIRIAGVDSSAGLYLDFETRFGQRRKDGRYKRDPPLPRITFFRHTDDHKALPV